MKKEIKILIIVLCVVFGVFILDYLRSVIFKKEPLIVVSTINREGVKISNGILYRTYNCNGTIYVESKTSKFDCPAVPKGISITQNNKDICVDGIDYFYEDENYRYYFTCMKSNYIFIKKDDKEYTLKNALNNKIITINDIKNLIEFNKESKKNTETIKEVELIKESSKCSTKSEKIYTYNKTEYYYDCSNNTYSLKIKGETFSLNKALESGKVTIEKLKELGLNVISREITNTDTVIKKDTDVIIEKENNTKVDIKKDETIDEAISNNPELVFIKNSNKDQKKITIYKDKSYEYYYYTPSYGNYNIKYMNKYYTVKDAINKNIITLSSLQGLGLTYLKTKLVTIDDNKVNPGKTDDNVNKDRKITLIDKSKGSTCAQAIEYFYEDNAYKYYFTCIKSSSMYLLIDGKEYLLKEALNNKVTTIKELEENGIKFLKQSKNLVTK